MDTSVKVAIIAAVIAGLAAVASWTRATPVLLGWFTSFSPAVTTGAPTLGSLPDQKLSAVFNFKILNTSGDDGCIIDFAFKFETLTEKHTWIIFPVFVVDMPVYARLVEARQNPLGSVKRRFSPLKLPGFAEREESFLFMHRPASEDPKDILSVSELKPDQYIMQLLVLEGDSSCSIVNGGYREVGGGRIDVTLNRRNIELLQTGGAVTPLPESIDIKRRELVRGH